MLSLYDVTRCIIRWLWVTPSVPNSTVPRTIETRQPELQITQIIKTVIKSTIIIVDGQLIKWVSYWQIIKFKTVIWDLISWTFRYVLRWHLSYVRRKASWQIKFVWQMSDTANVFIFTWNGLPASGSANGLLSKSDILRGYTECVTASKS